MTSSERQPLSSTSNQTNTIETHLTIKQLASEIGSPRDLKRVRLQLHAICEENPNIQPEFLEVQGQFRKYKITVFGIAALEELLKRNQIVLPDGKIIKTQEGAVFPSVLRTLVDGRERGKQIPKSQLITDLPVLNNLPPKKAKQKLNEILDFLNKKLKVHGWQINNVNGKGLTIITQQERETYFYNIRDVKSATNKSLRTAERYLREMLGAGINNVLLTEDVFKEVVLYIQSKEKARSQKLTKESLTSPDGQAIPNLISVQKQLLMQLADARNEERPFYIQESFDPVDSNPIARQFGEWNVLRHINMLAENKDMKHKGWVIDSLTQDAYFLRQEKESPQELRHLLETKRQIHINSTAIVLEHLTEESPADNINLRNIHILLANALHKSHPDSTLPSVFQDTTSEHLKKFFIYGFTHTLQRLWERNPTQRLSSEEKEIIDCCNKLKQNGYDTQKIINFAKLHFDIQNVDKPQPVAA